MDLAKIRPPSVALLVSALLVLAVGAYTGNGGFQLAGAIMLVSGLILALRQATRNSHPSD